MKFPFSLTLIVCLVASALPVTAEQEVYLSTWLAEQGRQAIFRLLEEGERRRGLLLYLRELPYQARHRSQGFLWRAPLLLVLPAPMVQRVRSCLRFLEAALNVS